MARCGHRQGLFVEGVAVETGGGGEAELELERERRGRESHPSTAERESRRRDLKKRKEEHKHGLRSCYLVNGFQLAHLGETSIPSFCRGFA